MYIRALLVMKSQRKPDFEVWFPMTTVFGSIISFSSQNTALDIVPIQTGLNAMEDLNPPSTSSTGVRDDIFMELSASSSSAPSAFPLLQCCRGTQCLADTHNTTKPYQECAARSQQGVPHPNSISLSNSSTQVDGDFNRAMAESWTAQTHAENEREPAEHCFILEVSPPSDDPDIQESSYVDIHRLFEEDINEPMRESSPEPALADGDNDANGRPLMLPERPLLANSVTGSSSSTRSHTLVNSTLEPCLTESWSAPTRAGSICEPNAIMAYANDLPERELPNETEVQAQKRKDALPDVRKNELERHDPLAREAYPEKGLHLPVRDCKSDDLVLTDSGTSPFSTQYARSLGKICALERYQNQDPSEESLTIFTLRTAGTICAFCGSAFTGPDHRQKVIDHTREQHLTTQGFMVTDKARPILNPKQRKRLARLSHCATNESLFEPSIAPSSLSGVSRQPINHPLKLSNDLYAIGAKWQDESRMRSKVSGIIPHGDWTLKNIRLANNYNPKALVGLITFTLGESSDPHDPEMFSKFISGFDLVAQNLIKKFPKNETVQGIQKALVSLVQASNLSFGGHPGGSSQLVAATSEDMKTCPVEQHTESSPSAGSSYQSNPCEQSSIGNSNGNSKATGQSSSVNKTSQDPSVGVQRARQKKLKKRLLACPIKRNHEVHGRHPACKYKGAVTMSGLKTHLMGNHHHPEVSFITLCKVCTDYVVDKTEWDRVHVTNNCIPRTETRRPQVRGDENIEVQWWNLYRRMFPESDSLPSPWVDCSTRCEDPARNHNRMELTAGNGDPEFDFNAQPINTPAPQNNPVISYNRSSPSYGFQVRDEIRPMRFASVTSQGPVLMDDDNDDTQPLSTGQSFLDGTQTTVHDVPPSTRGILSPPRVLTSRAEIPAEPLTTVVASNDYYHDFNNVTEARSAFLWDPTPIANLPQGAGVHPQTEENRFDVFETAALLLLHEYLERPSTSGHIIQLIARATVLTPEQLDVLSQGVKAGVDAIVEQGPSNVATIDSGNPTIPSVIAGRLNASFQTPASLDDSNTILCAAPNRGRELLSPDLLTPDVFNFISWDHHESVRLNPLSPDPTARTFFPELELSAVSS
ncbi:hypothetical protein GQ44DRAFT_763951 [Phaeosphaeriaceae sp. PMI808]|nr:hypothetical protein GQ44DRAFT_763951 [Phaeosphaeriaceae sp. PMI808]